MVHDQTDAFAVGIGIQCGQIEIGVGGDKVENKVFLLAVPVFPAFVPTFYQQTVESVGRGEVDVAAHILIVGTMLAVGLRMGVVGLAQLNRGILIGI